MREIKFRGYNRHTQKWYYGNLIKYWFLKANYYIRFQIETGGRFAEVQVEESSIGQMSQYKDQNGVEIYEGDITHFGKVVFEDGCFYMREGNTYDFLQASVRRNRNLIAIIGNDFERNGYFSSYDSENVNNRKI